MTDPEQNEIIGAWLRIPGMVEEVVQAIPAQELDVSDDSGAMSARETVHHLVEANIVAASMIIAALGASGSTYDWSWLYPNTAWVNRMKYDAVPLEPSLATLNGLCRHISNLVSARRDAMQCEVRLFETPGAEPYPMTVESILRHEAEHAEEHLGELRAKMR